MAREIELILARQWVGLLSVPVLLLDDSGDLIFYNEPAEVLVGRTYDESGPMVRAEWRSAFKAEDDDGGELDPDGLPMAVALDQDRPDQGSCWIRGMDGVRRRIRITAFPIRGRRRTRLGVMALFSTVD